MLPSGRRPRGFPAQAKSIKETSSAVYGRVVEIFTELVVKKTMAQKVVITRKLPEIATQLLIAKGYDVDSFLGDEEMHPEEMMMRASHCDAILCSLTEKIDYHFFSHSCSLKVVSNYAVGFDNIDLAAATHFNVMVTNTPNVLSNATAEMAWALLFATTRRIVAAHRYIQQKEFTGWNPFLFLGQDISGKTLGLIGAGRIGTAMALKSRGFNMPILYYNRSQNSVLEKELDARKVDLQTLCQQSDFISIHLPLTPETYHLLQAKHFSQMKNTAYLINTGRGAVVDEDALVAALHQGQISGAGLDVYEKEPEISEALLHAPNIVLTPHIAASTKQTREAMAKIAAENIITVLEGGIPPYLVNQEVLNNR